MPPEAAGAVLGLGPGGGNVDNNTGEITIPVGTEGTAILTEAVRRLDAQGIRLADIGLRRPTLDDVFLALTGHAAEGGSEDEAVRGRRSLEEAEAGQGEGADMSAITETLRQPGRLSATVSDWWVLTWRNLHHVHPQAGPARLLDDPAGDVRAAVRLRVRGAFELILPPSVPYVDFLMPGIFVQTAIFASTQTGVGLADDLQKGLIDRFRSLPMARSAVLAGRTAADTVSVTVQTVLMLIVAYLIGYRIHEGGAEALLAFVGVVSVGYAFTWVAAFAGLSLKTIEAVQAALFTIVFPFVFVSTAFVPLATFPSWLQPIVEHNPVTIWVDTVRVLTLGDLYSPQTSDLFADVKSLGTLLVAVDRVVRRVPRRSSPSWASARTAGPRPAGVRPRQGLGNNPSAPVGCPLRPVQ